PCSACRPVARTGPRGVWQLEEIRIQSSGIRQKRQTQVTLSPQAVHCASETSALSGSSFDGWDYFEGWTLLEAVAVGRRTKSTPPPAWNTGSHAAESST